MKAISIPEFGGPEVMELIEIPQPRPGASEVSISVEVAGVNFADALIRMGRHGGSAPVVPGLEVAGIVAEVGPGVSSFAAGDRVAAFVSQGYAECAVANATLTWHLADGLDFKQAAGFPTVGITAFNLLTKAGRLQPGEVVLIWSAAGGVGTTAVQLAKLLGASNVIGVVGSMEKAETAERAGCDHVVVSGEGPLTDQVKDLTGGRGADVILNAVAGADLEEDVDRLADFGRLVVYGLASGRPGLVPSNSLHSRSCSLVGYSTSTYRRSRPHEAHEAGRVMLSLLDAGKLKIFLGEEFPLEDATSAHRLIESRDSVGKILLMTSKNG